MNKLTVAALGVAAAGIVAVPAGLALAAAPSFDQSVPVRVPAHVSTVRFDDHGRLVPTRTTTRDDRDGKHTEPGDDRGKHTEPGDDNGRRTQARDDRGGKHTEPGDDRGKHTEPGDDHGRHHRGGDDGSGRHGSDG